MCVKMDISSIVFVWNVVCNVSIWTALLITSTLWCLKVSSWCGLFRAHSEYRSNSFSVHLHTQSKHHLSENQRTWTHLLCVCGKSIGWLIHTYNWCWRVLCWEGGGGGKPLAGWGVSSSLSKWWAKFTFPGDYSQKPILSSVKSTLANKIAALRRPQDGGTQVWHLPCEHLHMIHIR